MAVIIGRKQEQRELSRLYHSGEAEMVVVYGRRRVGKTYLVNQAFAQTGFAFKVTGLYKQKMSDQLKNFSMAIDEYFHEGERKLPVSWIDAFAQLKACLNNSKTGTRRVLFFDELLLHLLLFAIHQGQLWAGRAFLDSHARQSKEGCLAGL